MKNILLVCAIMLSGCAISLTHAERMATFNQVSIIDSWVNNTIAGETRSVAVVLANPKTYDIKFHLICECSWNGDFYGETTGELESGMKRTFLVRGWVINPEQRPMKCVVSVE